MRIRREIYHKILAGVPTCPPEIGGILGGTGEIVTAYCQDNGTDRRGGCCYTPDVDFLNRVIQTWSEGDLQFMGVYHTHFWGVKTLSEGDKRYIEQIMWAMPEGIDRLYFPVIVLPEKTMAGYVGRRCVDSVEIVSEEVMVI